MRAFKILAVVAVLALISNAAFAGLIIDLQATGVPAGYTLTEGGKTVTGPFAAGDVITFSVLGKLDVAGTIIGMGATIREFPLGSVRGDMTNAVTPVGGAPALVYPNGATGDMDFYGPGDDNFKTFNVSPDAAYQVTPSVPAVIGTFTYIVKASGLTSTKIALDATDVDMGGTGPSGMAGYFSWTAAGVAKDGYSNYDEISGGGPVTLNPVPEPATLVLLGMGALALVFIRRK
jgi:hypothetical protein